MKAKAVFLEIVWYLARCLVYIKRGFVFVFNLIVRSGKVFGSWYNKTIGFAIFKIGFYFKKRLFPESRRGNVSFWYSFGERWMLQLAAVLIAFFFVVPQTKLYKPQFGEVPGKKTLLYALVGPGEQDFASSDELIQETAVGTASNQAESWRQAAVIVEPQFNGDNESEVQYSTTLNGALVKPTLIAIGPRSSDLPSNTDTTQNRLTIVEYQVKSGDVIGKIARNYGISVTTILSANNLNQRSILRPGSVLKIPPADGAFYTIAKGDTIGKIAKLFGVSGNDILKFNNLNEKSLRVGKQILIPGGKQLPTKVAVNPRINNRESSTIPKIPVNVDVSHTVNTAGYIWPTGAHIITQYFGLRHTGVDIAGPIGLPNYAARDGVVVKSQCGYNGGYGCYIILDHGGGVQTLYGHNSQLLVSPGDNVSQGQVIGLLGSTGRSTGPHLHFEVRINGHRTNPLQFIRR